MAADRATASSPRIPSQPAAIKGTIYLNQPTASTKRPDAAFALAANVERTRYENLPAKAIEVTKQDILDTLGCMIAGSTAEAAREVVELGREFGGTPEASIVGFGDRLPSHMAAFINGTLGHALDLDDCHDKGITHVGPQTIAAALAVAESGRAGRVDGKTFIAAIAVGADVIARMALATKIPLQQSGWMFSPLYGYFGATAAASRILGLNQEQIINAFGIAYCQAAGNLQVNIDDEHALTKRLQIGFGCKAGVMSSLLACKGLTGARNSMEGRWGLYNLIHRGEYYREALVDELGQRYEIANISFKPYSCCRQIHAHIDAALRLRQEHGLRPADIRAVTIFVNTDPHWLCDPLPLRRRPPSVVVAQFSIPYSVAVALHNGKVVIEDFNKPARHPESVYQLADRVTPRHDASLPTRIIPPARMEILTADGRRLTTEVVDAKGHPNNPLSWNELAEKFRDCNLHSVHPLDSSAITRVVDTCRHLEDLDDIGKLAALVAPAH